MKTEVGAARENKGAAGQCDCLLLRHAPEGILLGKVGSLLLSLSERLLQPIGLCSPQTDPFAKERNGHEIRPAA